MKHNSNRHVFTSPVVHIKHFYHVICCFLATKISVFTHRVVVIVGICFHQQCFGHVSTPHLRVFAVFSSQRYCIVYVCNARVVGCDYKLFPLLGVGNVTLQRLVEVAYYRRSCAYARFGIGDAVHRQSVGTCRAGHDLHESACYGP